MRLLLAVLVLLALAAPAMAQTAARPIVGAYPDVYVIAGRVIDSEGDPASGARLFIELQQEGVTAKPLAASANCKGDFITAFDLVHVDPRGKALITVVDTAGKTLTSATVTLDPFYRRSDAVLRMDTTWDAVCSQEMNVWPVSASVSVRLLERTDAYEAGGETYHAKPFVGIVTMRYEPPSGVRMCPPHPQDPTPGACETFAPDERGDLRYTFTLDREFDAGGVVTLNLFRNQTNYVADLPDAVETIEIARETRLGVRMIEVTGRGPPPEIYETPGLGALTLLAGVALALVVASRR